MPSPTEVKIDPIVTTIVQRKLEAIAEEIADTLLRTTRSSLLSQAGDLGCAVLGPKGELLAGAEHVPILALSLGFTCEAVVGRFGDDIGPGDVFMHNDVFSGSPQNSDAGILIPVFRDSALVAWVASRGHQLDIGGPVPGGCNPLATEVWQEALRIPPVKVVEDGVMRTDVWNLVFANIRARETVEADMLAQIGACRVGARELGAFIDKYGAEAFTTHCGAMLAAGERMMRAALSRIPDGTYRGSSVVNTDMWGELEQHDLHVAVTIEGDRLEVDFTGTAPQTKGYANAPLASSSSATTMALFAIVGAEIPHNDGVLRPLTLTIPEGTMLNPRFPAATFYGNFMSVHIYEAIMDALRDAVPAAVGAAWNRAYDIRTAGIDPRHERLYAEIHFLGLKGGTGAVQGLDGYSQGSPVFAPALRTQDYELNEAQHPHFIVRHEYLTDSAGVGEWRGGLGVVYYCQLDGEALVTVTQGDGLLQGARGVHGGGAGTLNQIVLEAPDGRRRELRAMEITPDVAQGTVVHQRSGGGGGYGDPLARNVERVRADVQDALVSVEAARRDYGVVVTLDDHGTALVDAEATAGLRAATEQHTPVV